MPVTNIIEVSGPFLTSMRVDPAAPGFAVLATRSHTRYRALRSPRGPQRCASQYVIHGAGSTGPWSAAQHVGDDAD